MCFTLLSYLTLRFPFLSLFRLSSLRSDTSYISSSWHLQGTQIDAGWLKWKSSSFGRWRLIYGTQMSSGNARSPRQRWCRKDQGSVGNDAQDAGTRPSLFLQPQELACQASSWVKNGWDWGRWVPPVLPELGTMMSHFSILLKATMRSHKKIINFFNSIYN